MIMARTLAEHSARGHPGERLRRQAVERLDGELEVLRLRVLELRVARGRGGSGRRASPSARRRATPRRRRGAARSAAGATSRRPPGPPRRRSRPASRRRGSARSARSARTRPRCSPPARSARTPRARPGSSIEASFVASRWRMSSSCSAVSTTEVTIPGLQTTPPLVQHGAVADLRCDLPQLESELRGAGERVAALVHRRRAGVRGLAAPGDPVALDAERAEHGAERQVQRLEHRPLLDVQLEVGGCVLELRARVERASRDRRRARRSASGSATPSRSLQLRAARPGRPSSRRPPTSRRASARSARPPRRPS